MRPAVNAAHDASFERGRSKNSYSTIRQEIRQL